MADRMRPVMILPTGKVSPRDVKRLVDNGICVVETDDPSTVRFMEPPPQDYSVQERAAISLCRYIMSGAGRGKVLSHIDFASLLCDFLITGSPLRPVEAPKEPRK